MSVAVAAVDTELERLLEAARAGDERAAEAVVERFLPLVRVLALRYAGRGEPVEDLIQVGSVGLVLAVQRFDPERGVQFKSFAIPTIVGEIQRHFRDRAWALHVPRRLKELSLRLSRATEQLTADLGRSPTVAELADAADVSEDEVIDALDVSNAYSTRSLSSTGVFDDPDYEPGDALRVDEPGFDEVEDAAIVETGFAALGERERRIVELRFFAGLTQSEIAAEIGISQMHVSRLLHQALTAMRGRLEEEGGELDA
jgi:RNA polymerase sigma-B factor